MFLKHYLSYIRRKKSSLLAKTISCALKQFAIQPQTGKTLEVHIICNKEFVVSKTHQKTHTHTKIYSYCQTFRTDLITISK